MSYIREKVARAIHDADEAHCKERWSEVSASYLVMADAAIAAAEADALRAEVERLRDGIDAINQYSTDTLSGPTKRVDDTRDWQRQSVSEVTRRSRLLLRGYHWDAVDEGDTPKGRAALEETKP